MKTKTALFFLTLIVTAPSLYSQEAFLPAFAKSIEMEYSGQYPKAIAALTEVYDEKSYEINLRLGWLNYQAGQHLEATRYYEKAIAIMPYSIEAKMGFVLPSVALGNWEPVIVQYKKILEIDPQNSVVNYRMGLVEYNAKRYAIAYKYFEKVVNLYPFGYDGLLMFAWTNFQLGKPREAKVLFQKVLMIAPVDKSALEGLGLIK
jgi:tetratricopeptide (TPR) repeat protein